MEYEIVHLIMIKFFLFIEDILSFYNEIYINLLQLLVVANL